LEDERMRVLSSIGLVIAMVFATGCSGMSNTAKGGLIGGGGGAIVGTAIGSATGNAGTGALIGGGAGTIIGGLIGNDVDQEEKQRMQNRVVQAEATAADAQQQGQQLGITGVAQMCQQGFSDEVIINQIRSTRSTFTLSTTDLQWLKENGVRDSLIAFMQTCRPQPIAPPRVIYREAPPVYYHPHHRPVVIIERPPPQPVGFGFSYTRVR